MLVAFPQNTDTHTQTDTHTKTNICTHTFFFLFFWKRLQNFASWCFLILTRELFFSVLLLILYKQWCIEMQLSWQLFHKLKANPYHTNAETLLSRQMKIPGSYSFFLTLLTWRIHFSMEKSLVSLIKVDS